MKTLNEFAEAVEGKVKKDMKSVEVEVEGTKVDDKLDGRIVRNKEYRNITIICYGKKNNFVNTIYRGTLHFRRNQGASQGVEMYHPVIFINIIEKVQDTESISKSHDVSVLGGSIDVGVDINLLRLKAIERYFMQEYKSDKQALKNYLYISKILDINIDCFAKNKVTRDDKNFKELEDLIDGKIVLVNTWL